MIILYRTPNTETVQEKREELDDSRIIQTLRTIHPVKEGNSKALQVLKDSTRRKQE